MSQDDIHGTLENARAAAEELVSEMSKHRSARELLETETENLGQVNDLLRETAERIRPYREDNVRRYRAVVIGGVLFNTFLLFLLFALVILRT